MEDLDNEYVISVTVPSSLQRGPAISRRAGNKPHPGFLRTKLDIGRGSGGCEARRTEQEGRVVRVWLPGEVVHSTGWGSGRPWIHLPCTRLHWCPDDTRKQFDVHKIYGSATGDVEWKQ